MKKIVKSLFFLFFSLTFLYSVWSPCAIRNFNYFYYIIRISFFQRTSFFFFSYSALYPHVLICAPTVTSTDAITWMAEPAQFFWSCCIHCPHVRWWLYAIVANVYYSAYKIQNNITQNVFFFRYMLDSLAHAWCFLFHLTAQPVQNSIIHSRSKKQQMANLHTNIICQSN